MKRDVFNEFIPRTSRSFGARPFTFVHVRLLRMTWVVVGESELSPKIIHTTIRTSQTTPITNFISSSVHRLLCLSVLHFLPFQRKPNLERYLVMLYVPIHNMSACFGHFKPAQIIQRLTGTTNGIFNGIFNACC